jgi:hypothetical protein
MIFSKRILGDSDGKCFFCQNTVYCKYFKKHLVVIFWFKKEWCGMIHLQHDTASNTALCSTHKIFLRYLNGANLCLLAILMWRGIKEYLSKLWLIFSNTELLWNGNTQMYFSVTGGEVIKLLRIRYRTAITSISNIKNLPN